MKPCGRGRKVTPSPEAPFTPLMSTVPKPGADRLVEAFRSYSHAIAAEVIRKYPTVDRDDIRGSAELGLVEAANNFDPSRGVLFKTFAFYRIRGAIYVGLRKMGWFAKDSRLKFESGANEYMKDYVESAPPAASGDDAAKELENITASVVNCYFLSLTDMPGEVAETGTKSVEERYGDQEMRERLREALTRLPPKNRQVLEDYYFRDQTLETIGERLGLSKSWVSRLHAKSLEMARTVLEQSGITGAATG
jgi:RNA polymerase sigma factor for flagellar operon FliA